MPRRCGLCIGEINSIRSVDESTNALSRNKSCLVLNQMNPAAVLAGAELKQVYSTASYIHYESIRRRSRTKQQLHSISCEVYHKALLGNHATLYSSPLQSTPLLITCRPFPQLFQCGT